jgi:hypothetical protein
LQGHLVMLKEESQLAVVAESGNDTQGMPSLCKIGVHAPWYVVVAWTVSAIAYVTYQLLYLLPDLRAWFAIARG